MTTSTRDSGPANNRPEQDFMTHTPGPWHVGNGDIYANGNATSDFDDVVICAIGKGSGTRSHEYAVVRAHKSEGRANAHLIAAAPDLLAQLKFAVKLLAGFPAFSGSAQVEAMRAALAKAQPDARIQTLRGV